MVYMAAKAAVLSRAQSDPLKIGGSRGINPSSSQRPVKLRDLISYVLVSALVLLALGGGARAGEPDLGESNLVPRGPLNFAEAVRLAIHQSPYLLRTSIEIDLRRLDESDSRYGMIPPITFRSYYYVNLHNTSLATTPPITFTSRPYSLTFAFDPYNPFASYFTLQAQKLVTRMAIFNHLKVISEGLHRLGRMFLELDNLSQVAACQNDLVKVARESLTYAENRASMGTVTTLEVKVAKQEWQVAQNEQEQIGLSQKRISESLRAFLGLKPDQEFKVDFRNAPQQVLGSFNPETTTLEQAKSHSYDLKAMEIQKEIQGFNISVAKAKIFPTLLFNAQTPDPLSLTSASGMYFAFGLDVPIWDGFKRIRNVSRQKAIQKQMGASKDLKEFDLADAWRAGQQDVQNAATALKLAQSQEELARLKERQSEIRYQSGSEPLPTWLEGRKGVLEAQKNGAAKSLEYAEAVLGLRQISGDLGYSYVDENSWQK
jgi:outer membrane protein TolC